MKSKIGDLLLSKTHAAVSRFWGGPPKPNIVEFANSMLKQSASAGTPRLLPFTEDLKYQIGNDKKINQLSKFGIVVFKDSQIVSTSEAEQLRLDVLNVEKNSRPKMRLSSCIKYYELKQVTEAVLVQRNGTADNGMIDVFNVEYSLSDESIEILRRIQSFFTLHIEKHLSRKYKFRGFNCYISRGVSCTRGPHIDNYFGSLKGFCFLDDCLTIDDGPHIYFPSSINALRRTSTLLRTYLNVPFEHYTDASLQILSSQHMNGRIIFGRQGEGFLSNQSGFHFGAPQSSNAERIMLVANFE
jgi:hypothetical protein